MRRELNFECNLIIDAKNPIVCIRRLADSRVLRSRDWFNLRHSALELLGTDRAEVAIAMGVTG